MRRRNRTGTRTTSKRSAPNNRFRRAADRLQLQHSHSPAHHHRNCTRINVLYRYSNRITATAFSRLLLLLRVVSSFGRRARAADRSQIPPSRRGRQQTLARDNTDCKAQGRRTRTVEPSGTMSSLFHPVSALLEKVRTPRALMHWAGRSTTEDDRLLLASAAQHHCPSPLLRHRSTLAMMSTCVTCVCVIWRRSCRSSSSRRRLARIRRAPPPPPPRADHRLTPPPKPASAPSSAHR